MRSISFLLLSVSITILIYILYKDIYIHKSVLRIFYLKYYFIFTSLILFSITTYFINEQKKIRLFKISFYLIISLYGIEGLLNLRQQYYVNKLTNKLENNLNKNNTFEKRTFTKYILEENIKQKNIFVNSSVFRNQNDLKILPLSNKSFTNYLKDNKESGNYLYFQTDRYGFINIDDEWDKNIVEALVLGDSFLRPGGNNNNISTYLKKLISENKKLKRDRKKGSIIQLGSSGGTLHEYALVKEYMNNKKFKNLILFYYEANDLTNLQNELKDPILKKYFEQEKFIQNLIYKQHIVDNMYDNYEIVKLIQNNVANGAFAKKTISQRIKERYKFEWSRFVKLYALRKLIIEPKENKPIDEFKILLKKFKKLTKNNNTNFYFVYVPEINRYLKNFELNGASKYYKDVIKILKDLEISTIDLNKELYLKASNPLKYFPLESFGHATINTNIAVSKIIYDRIYNNE